MARTRFFSELGLADVLSAGGKGANLGELSRAGLPVPPGFVVATECFAEFLETLDPSGAERAKLESLDANDVAAIAAAGAEMRARIESADAHHAIDQAIAASHAKLCEAGETPVAVRSSATSEDSEEASFAGLQDTYLWLRGADAVKKHVRACWASLYSAESLSYRRRLGMREEGLSMGVVVQRMADSRASGVMFTRSPLTGDRSVIAIEGSYGLGSCIVSGEVTPDKFIVNKVTGDIMDRAISRKTMQHLPDLAAGGVTAMPVPEERQDIPSISDEEIAALAQLARKVERHYGRPQDIEWAITRAGELFLLQSRPETVWARKDAEPVAKPKANAMEHVFAMFGGNR